jgi:diguanylate cyclase (GGDEF)-like protein
VQAATHGRSIVHSRLELHRPDLVWILIIWMAAAGAGLVSLVSGPSTPVVGQYSLPWWLLAGLFYLAEVRVVHIQFQREAHSFTLSDVPLVLGLFLASPTDLVLACVVGGTLGLLIHRRPAPIKLAFNAALFLVGSSVAVVLFHRLAPFADPLQPMTWIAASLATIAVTLLGLLAVNAAIWLAQGRSDRRRIGVVVRFGLVVAVTNSCLALIVITLLWSERGATWLVAIPLALVAVAWRSYQANIDEREQRESLELLYRTTSILHGNGDLEGAIVALLTEARHTFRAEFAELILFTADGHEEGLRTALGPRDDVEVMNSVRLDRVTDALRLQAVAEGVAFRAPRIARGSARTDRIRDHVVNDAMVAPLMGEHSLIGTFVMANRQGALGTFSADELRLFQTLANHAGVALENGRLGQSLKDLSDLKDQLRHQALHDSLTGMGNRDLFLDRLRTALQRRGNAGPVPVVLFIDVDDFKSVNDTVGHAGGDDLLRAVAEAIGRSVRPGDLGVRLAGDEFAVLVEDGRDIGAVIRIAERIGEAVARPVELDGRWISTSASIGIAASRSRVQSADELLRDADVAMYTAKARGKGRFAVFEPSMRAELSDRQQLRDDLSGAVGHGELALLYQPVSDVQSGEVLGFEALLRWNHPTRGELAPAAFLALAEESGLIVPIGRWVLRQACHQARDWGSSDGHPLSVSVNISLRQLTQPEFVDDVAGVLRATGLQPELLMLEFAEAQVMTDHPLIASRLRDLKSLGVILAIDGFGNGFSSVRHLGRYPVDVIKIARPVVATMSRTAGDKRIAEAIVALGHSLRLKVVAEGVESLSQLEDIRNIDCDSVQGFYLAVPLKASGIGQLLDGGARLPAIAPAA